MTRRTRLNRIERLLGVRLSETSLDDQAHLQALIVGIKGADHKRALALFDEARRLLERMQRTAPPSPTAATFENFLALRGQPQW